MHNILFTFFIALTNNLDNIGVRIAYSIRGITITPLINGWISVITFAISFCSAYFGTFLSGILSKQSCSVIAMFLLTAIGLWMIFEPYIRKYDPFNQEPAQEIEKRIFHVVLNPLKADMDNSKHIDFKEATLLGLGLSINNVGGALSAGMIGLDAFWVGFLSAILSFLALWAGNYIAMLFLKWKITHKAAVIAGMLLIAIGIKQVLQ